VKPTYLAVRDCTHHYQPELLKIVSQGGYVLACARKHTTPTAFRAGDSSQGLLAPPSQNNSTDVWFLYRRHRVVFVIDTSSSMRMLRGVVPARIRSPVPHSALAAGTTDSPLHTVARTLRDCFTGLARPLGGVGHQVRACLVLSQATHRGGITD
jgi:hypothetical protein